MAVILVPGKMIDLRAFVHPDDGVGWTAGFGVRFTRELIGAGRRDARCPRRTRGGCRSRFWPRRRRRGRGCRSRSRLRRPTAGAALSHVGLLGYSLGLVVGLVGAPLVPALGRGLLLRGRRGSLRRRRRSGRRLRRPAARTALSHIGFFGYSLGLVVGLVGAPLLPALSGCLLLRPRHGARQRHEADDRRKYQDASDMLFHGRRLLKPGAMTTWPGHEGCGPPEKSPDPPDPEFANSARSAIERAGPRGADHWLQTAGPPPGHITLCPFSPAAKWAR